MRRAARLAVAALLLGTAACRTETVAVVENTLTGDRVECRANPLFGDLGVQRELCVMGFERVGYAVVSP
jgi:hypothetical protein